MKKEDAILSELSKRWVRRKSKFYNRSGNCSGCGRPVSRYEKYCLVCRDLMRWQAEDERDYQDTIASIRADWHW